MGVDNKVTNGVTTPIKNRKRFLTPLVSAGCLLIGLEAACSGSSGEVRLRSARAKAFARAERSRTPPDPPEQAASNPVIRQPALTSGVRKRLPFSLCIRPEVSTPL